MQEPEQPSSGWIKLCQAGFGVEVLVFVATAIVSLIAATVIHLNNILSLIILVFGFNKVFWDTVRKLATEDAINLGLDPNKELN